ncbi:hypothetical protein LIER_32144 [Lithospermum erythrorhizon]|uniref:Retrovirus-related Pol polyprotein from transposon TNT 1-94-like beta-barrel domain-containing protein n=1 Tax=Lithospermum erythrorhizon TaxID=34254 RepID=A0AAV3RYZ0_LITER
MNIEDDDQVTFYPDSGASAHMTGNSSILTYLQPYYGNDKVMVGNDTLLPITHIGRVRLTTTSVDSLIKDVLLVLQLKQNLLSIHKFYQNKCCTVEFNNHSFLVKDKKTQVPFLKCSNQGSLYPFSSSYSAYFNTLSVVLSKSVTWHQRLGHPGDSVFHFMV